MDIKSTILLYLMNQSDNLDNRYSELRDYIRYHKADEVDYIELIIAKARKDLFDEIRADLTNIIKMRLPKK